MMHKDKKIDPKLIQSFLDISITEFRERFWGSSQQYLEVMEILIKDTLPVVARIEKENDSSYAVYFSVKDEKALLLYSLLFSWGNS